MSSIAFCIGDALIYCCLQALQRTLEFEEELAEKFGGGSRSKETGSESGEEMGKTNQTVSDIRKKYEKKLASHGGSENEACMHLFFCAVNIIY